MIKCNKINSITLFPNGKYIKCIDDFIDTFNNTRCSLYSEECNTNVDNITNCIFVINNKCYSNCIYCCDSLYSNLMDIHLFDFCFEKVKKVIDMFNKINKITFGYYEPLYDIDTFKVLIKFLVDNSNIKTYDIFTDGLAIDNQLLLWLNSFDVSFNIYINLNFPKEIHYKYKNQYIDNIINNIMLLSKYKNITINVESVIFVDNLGKEEELLLDLNYISQYTDSLFLLYNIFDLEFYKMNYKKILYSVYDKLNLNNDNIKYAIDNLKIKKNTNVIKSDYYYKEKFKTYKELRDAIKMS